MEESGETTEGIPEFGWSWEYTVEGEWETATGKTWREFIESLENLTFLSIDVSSFVDEIHELLGTSEYADILSDKYEVFDAEEEAKREANTRKAKVETQKALDEWLQSKPVVKLRAIGYKIDDPHGLEVVEAQSVEKLDTEALECLIQLDHRPAARRWWETVISCRDEIKLNRLAKLLDVNEQFRKHRWHKVYDAEYPVTLTIKSGWQVGLDRLLEIGVDTKQLTSKGEREFEYYDLHVLCASHGIDSSLIDE